MGKPATDSQLPGTGLALTEEFRSVYQRSNAWIVGNPHLGSNVGKYSSHSAMCL